MKIAVDGGKMGSDEKSGMDIQKVKNYWIEEASEALQVAWHLYEKGIRPDRGCLQMAKVNSVTKVNDVIIDKVQRFLRKLEEEGITLESTYLFGSYARCTENEWSDIDVAIISSDLTGDRFKERIRLTKIAQCIDSRIEPVPFRPDTFVEEDPLVWEIKRKGILLGSRTRK